MFKVVFNQAKGTVSITNYSDSDSKVILYREARVDPFYLQQIYEVHSKEKFVALLPMSQTGVFYEYDK